MAVLKKLRTRWWSSAEHHTENPRRSLASEAEIDAAAAFASDGRYEVRPLTISQIDEVWRLDQRCFTDGEAYSMDTFEYLLTSPEVISFRAMTITKDVMIGFIVGLIEPDRTGHITTVGIAPEHRRRRIAHKLMQEIETSFTRARINLVRLEVRSTNEAAQKLYINLGYTITQRLPRYYSNGGDGLLMVKSLDVK